MACEPADDPFSPHERIYISMIFSLPAFFGWVGWLRARYEPMGSRDIAIICAALVALLVSVFWAKRTRGLHAAAEEGLLVSAAWCTLALIAARSPDCEIAASRVAALYAAGAVALFFLIWHVLPVRALVDPACSTTRRRRYVYLWLGSVVLLDASVFAAASTVARIAPAGPVRTAALAASVIAFAGVVAIMGVFLERRRLVGSGGRGSPAA